MDFINIKGSKKEDKKVRDNLVIIDSLNLAFRYKYANKISFAKDYINTIESFGNSYGAKDIVVLGDGGSIYRESIYPKYKNSRKVARNNQTDEEAQQFKAFLAEYNRAFEELGKQYITLRYKGVEADDLAAYLVNNYKSNYAHTWLISSDRDWDLLIEEDVSRFSYVTRKEIMLKNWDTHYDYNPEDHISIKVLMGDKGDDVPGVEGVGPVRAIKLVEQYGSAYDIYDALPIESHYKHIQNLNTFGDKLLLNYELMDLLTYCEEAIGVDNLEDMQETFNV